MNEMQSNCVILTTDEVRSLVLNNISYLLTQVEEFKKDALEEDNIYTELDWIFDIRITITRLEDLLILVSTNESISLKKT